MHIILHEMNWYSQKRWNFEKWVLFIFTNEVFKTKQKEKQRNLKIKIERGIPVILTITSNVLTIINATVNGAESSTSYDSLDDELRGVNLPLLPPGDSGPC